MMDPPTVPPTQPPPQGAPTPKGSHPLSVHREGQVDEPIGEGSTSPTCGTSGASLATGQPKRPLTRAVAQGLIARGESVPDLLLYGAGLRPASRGAPRPRGGASSSPPFIGEGHPPTHREPECQSPGPGGLGRRRSESVGHGGQPPSTDVETVAVREGEGPRGCECNRWPYCRCTGDCPCDPRTHPYSRGRP